jgi:hypothetical protein
MAATILGGLWESGLRGQTETTSTHHQFMSALAQYIQGNVTFMGIFSGVNPSGTPLTTSLTMMINPGALGGEVTSCQDPKGGDGYAQWKAWIMQVYSKITADCGLLPSSFVPFTPIPCFKLVSPITWDRPDLANAVKGNEKNPQGPCLDRMANGFMDDMKIDFIPVFPGQVGAYVGAFTVSSVQTP